MGTQLEKNLEFSINTPEHDLLSLEVNTHEKDLIRKTDLSNVKHKKHSFGKDKSVDVYDGIFDYSEISGIYNALTHGEFKLANANRGDVQTLQDRKLVFHLTPQILDSIHFWDGALDPIIKEQIPLDEYSIFKAYVNLGLYTDTHEVHADHYYDRAGKTLLYYVNESWNRDWGGETQFLNSNAEEVLFTTPFVPGRVVIFDSNIPHSAKPQAINGPAYRFTLAIKFFKNDEKYR
jgi:hypothetical protein